MSISTLDSLQSVRMLDEAAKEMQAYQSNLRGVTEEMREGFSLVGAIPANRIAIQRVDYAKNRVGFTNVATAMLEMVQDGQADDELLAVLEKSDCALVAKLREKLCEAWIATHASEVADYTV